MPKEASVQSRGTRRFHHLHRVRRLASPVQPPSPVLPEISAGVVEAENGNSRGHGQRLKHPEEPLCAECVSIHTLGELGNAENAANLGYISIGSERKETEPYHDQYARDIDGQNHLSPPCWCIWDLMPVGQDVEPPKDAQEEGKGEELEGQSCNQNISTETLLIARPVVGTRNARSATLDEEGNNITADEDRCQAMTGDPDNAVVRRGQDGEDKPADEHVVTGCDEYRGEHGHGERHDKRCLQHMLVSRLGANPQDPRDLQAQIGS